jgi:hypothetical protein
MLSILFLTIVSNIYLLIWFVEQQNQVKKMDYEEIRYLSELRKRSDRDYLRPTFEKWKHDKFRALWFIYSKTDMSEPFNEFCWSIFKERIIIEIEQ